MPKLFIVNQNCHLIDSLMSFHVKCMLMKKRVVILRRGCVGEAFNGLFLTLMPIGSF